MSTRRPCGALLRILELAYPERGHKTTGHYTRSRMTVICTVGTLLSLARQAQLETRGGLPSRFSWRNRFLGFSSFRDFAKPSVDDANAKTRSISLMRLRGFALFIRNDANRSGGRSVPIRLALSFATLRKRTRGVFVLFCDHAVIGHARAPVNFAQATIKGRRCSISFER